MMLAKPEFVTVYEVLLSDEDIDDNIGELTLNLNAIMSTHENGRMFMAFKANNDHVNSESSGSAMMSRAYIFLRITDS